MLLCDFPTNWLAWGMAKRLSLRRQAACLNPTRKASTGFPWRRRLYSTAPPDEHLLKNLPNIDPAKLTISETEDPKDLLPPEQLVWGRSFTDHMLSIEWTSTDGWLPPRITPYQNLSLDPASCVFHYAFCAFEGTKAYRNVHTNRIHLFRPEANMARLNRSAARIALPQFSGTAFKELMGKFCQLEGRFIPESRGYALYLRPTIIGTQRTLGVGPSASALLYLIASPVGPYFPTGFKAVSLEASSTAIRAWPGGIGDKKLGANYAPCILPQMDAATRGFQQNLWLFKDPKIDEEYVTEVGTMNLFTAMKHQDGTKELVTAPLDGTILEGVIRDSILRLARERLPKEGWVVNERRYTMREVAEAADEGRLIEVFGSGTAAVVSPVRNISWNGRMVDCGLPPDSEAGELARRMKDWIEGIQYGDEKHPWSVEVG